MSGNILILRDSEVFEGVIGAVFTVVFAYYFKDYKGFEGYNAIMAAWISVWFIRKISLNVYEYIKEKYEVTDNNIYF
jgi:hypothetical protein